MWLGIACVFFADNLISQWLHDTSKLKTETLILISSFQSIEHMAFWTRESEVRTPAVVFKSSNSSSCAQTSSSTTQSFHVYKWLSFGQHQHQHHDQLLRTISQCAQFLNVIKFKCRLGIAF